VGWNRRKLTWDRTEKSVPWTSLNFMHYEAAKFVVALINFVLGRYVGLRVKPMVLEIRNGANYG